jgi:endonuclease-3
MTEAIQQALLQHRQQLAVPTGGKVAFNTGIAASEDLLNDLVGHPHAFVLACVMDRQVKAERAWLIPHLLRQRLGSFEFSYLAGLPVERLLAAFSESPHLHRFPEAMARNAHAAIHEIDRKYSSNAAGIWSDCPSSALLVLRFLRFPGVGPKIATMAANILVRDFHVAVSDRFSLDVSPDVQVHRVFTRLGLIRKEASNEELTYTARAMNPEYPGIFDLAAWDVGRTWCHAKEPDCARCALAKACPKLVDHAAAVGGP